MPDPTPAVSIVIPAYHHEAFVGEAVRSALTQDFDPLEVIVVDDASPDGTSAVVEAFDDPRLRFFPQRQNGGISAASNLALRECRGRFVALLGSDDAMHPRRVAAQVAALEADASLGAVFTGAEIIGDRGEPLDQEWPYAAEDRTREESLRWFFLKGNALCAPSAMFRADAARGMEFDPRLLQLQDYDFWVQMALAGHGFRILPEKLTRYRVRSGGENTSAPNPEREARIQFERIMVLRRFLAIRSAAEFAAIFPDHEIEGALRDDLVPLYVALRALQGNPKPDLREFGLRALFDFLGDPQNAAAAAEAHGFRMADFFRLTGTSPLGHLSRAGGADAAKADQARRDAEANLKEAKKAANKLEKEIARMKSASLWKRLRGW
ncbi:MAG: glycosyltransferase [Verrucomicrobiales bacterium]